MGGRDLWGKDFSITFTNKAAEQMRDRLMALGVPQQQEHSDGAALGQLDIQGMVSGKKRKEKAKEIDDGQLSLF